MAELFLSYSSKDTDRVRLAHSAFERHGFTVFWANSIAPASDDWNKIILQELNAARLVLVFWTDNSVESGPVRQEFEQAADDRKLMQIVLDQLKPMQFPMHSAYAAQRTSLIGWTGDDAHPEWAKLVAEIERRLMVGWVRRREAHMQALLDAERLRCEGAEARFAVAQQRLREEYEAEKAAQADLKMQQQEIARLQGQIELVAGENVKLRTILESSKAAASRAVQFQQELDQERNRSLATMWEKYAAKSLVIAEGVTAGATATHTQLVVDGSIEGDVFCGFLHVGPKGIIRGRVKAFFVVSYGSIHGNIDAVGITLKASSTTDGDLSHAGLWIEQGAHFEGKSRRKKVIPEVVDSSYAMMFGKLMPSSPTPSTGQNTNRFPPGDH